MTKAIKCYGMYIDTAEVVLNIASGKMDVLLDGLSLVGVYQDPDGQRQVLIFRKKEQLKRAFDKAKSLDFTSVEICQTMIYVPESDIKKEGDSK